MNQKVTHSTPLGTMHSHVSNTESLKVLSELSKCTPSLPSHMSVSECHILKWSITAISDCSNFMAVCEIDLDNKSDGAPESGQWLDAQTWENKTHILSIGTDDGEYLCERAKENRVPKRYLNNNTGYLDWVEYREKGLMIKVPTLLKNETIELRFSIAWKDKGNDKDDISTWYAVDLALH